MKKILFLLLSVTVGVGYTSVGNARNGDVGLTYDEAFPEENNGMCMADAGETCGQWGTGGSAEQKACKDDKGNWKNVDSDCQDKIQGAKVAKCKKNGTDDNGGDIISCVARECKDGYLLWTTSKRKEIDVVEEPGRKVGSQGSCKLKTKLQERCDNGCKKCNPDEKCVLKEVTVTNYSKNIAAFIGEEMCVCQATKQSCDEKYHGKPKRVYCCLAEEKGIAKWVGDDDTGHCECVNPDEIWDEKTNTCIKKPSETVVDEYIECLYYLNVDIQCKNGNSFNKNVAVKLDPNKIKQSECELLKKNMTDLERLITTGQGEISSYSDLIKSVCGDNQGIIGQKEIREAKAKLTNFFRDAEKNASVWKTEDGGFNAARLASDLTAGVVLGTVGGVVSGHVIKKKQIEKGFEVLHCAVGGQTVADWGDEFKIRLFYQ